MRAEGNMRLLPMAVCGMLLLMVTACDGYKSKFGCRGYPEASACLPVSEVYDHRHEDLVKVKPEGATPSSDEARPNDREERKQGVVAVAGRAEVELGRPIVTPPVVLRVWLAPWRDAKNRLHEASVVYAIVQDATWRYGRSEGLAQGGPVRVVTPFMSPRMAETGGKKAQPTAGPGAAGEGTSKSGVTLPSPSRDTNAVMRQLQQQLPSFPSGQAAPPSARTSSDYDLSEFP